MGNVRISFIDPTDQFFVYKIHYEGTKFVALTNQRFFHKPNIKVEDISAVMTGKQYLHWMQLSMDFAGENREKMLLAVKAILEKWIGKYKDLQLEFSHDINCHHNYVVLGKKNKQDAADTVIPGSVRKIFL